MTDPTERIAHLQRLLIHLNDMQQLGEASMYVGEPVQQKVLRQVLMDAIARAEQEEPDLHRITRIRNLELNITYYRKELQKLQRAVTMLGEKIDQEVYCPDRETKEKITNFIRDEFDDVFIEDGVFDEEEDILDES